MTKQKYFLWTDATTTTKKSETSSPATDKTTDKTTATTTTTASTTIHPITEACAPEITVKYF